MSSSSHVARNFLALGSGEMVSRVIAFGVTVYLARMLGAEGYGVIAFATGVALYLSKIADFGIEVVGAREIAKAPGSVNNIASSVMSIRLVFTFLLTALSILVVQLFLPQPERTILSLYFLTMIPIAASTKWILLGLENARPIGLTRIVGEALALGIVISLVRSRGDLWAAPVAQVASEFIIAFILIIVLRKQNFKFGFHLNMATALPIFMQALPLLGQTLLWLFIYNSDLIFLRLLRNRESVGYYAAAYTLICFLANIGFSYGMSLLPTLTRLGARSAGEKTLYQTAIVHAYVVCMPITIGGFLLASKIIQLGFGKDYANSIVALQVLIWCIPLSVLRMVPWAALVARGYQSLLLKAVFYSVLVNIALNVLLIPKYGITGAAIATVITECLTGVLMMKYAAGHQLPFASLRRFWRPTVATLIMAVMLIVLMRSNLAISLVIGVASYGLVLTLLGGIRLHKDQFPTLNV